MSATAFQRMRRDQKAAEKVEECESPTLTKKELKALLDEKGIEYDVGANKETLIKLLEGVE